MLAFVGLLISFEHHISLHHDVYSTSNASLRADFEREIINRLDTAVNDQRCNRSVISFFKDRFTASSILRQAQP